MNKTERVIYYDTRAAGLPGERTQGCGQTHHRNGWPKAVRVAWMLADETNDRVISSRVMLVRPEGFTIPQVASGVHGITTREAFEKGQDIREVLRAFTSDLAVADRRVGHNLYFDNCVLASEYRCQGMRQAACLFSGVPQVCTMERTLALCALPGESGYRYPRLSELHMTLFGESFDAGTDPYATVKATRRCYRELRRRELI